MFRKKSLFCFSSSQFEFEYFSLPDEMEFGEYFWKKNRKKKSHKKNLQKSQKRFKKKKEEEKKRKWNTTKVKFWKPISVLKGQGFRRRFESDGWLIACGGMEKLR